MNNNVCIIFAGEGNSLVVYIQIIPDEACSPLQEYPSEPRHLSESVWDSYVGWAPLPGVPKVHSSALTYSQISHKYSPSTSVQLVLAMSPDNLPAV